MKGDHSRSLPSSSHKMSLSQIQIVQKHISLDDVDFFRALPEPTTVLNMGHLKSGDSLVHIACRRGSVKVLKYLIVELKAEMEVSNKNGKRPLHEAAQSSREDCVRVLLEHGAHVDSLKQADWTPLMLACTKQSNNVVNILLKAGANPLLKNKDGWNSFHIACREGNLSVIETLLDHCHHVWDTKSNNLRSPLHTAAMHGHKETVYWMLHACHYNTDERDSCGTTPLMDALRAGHVETAKILIDHHKADVTIEDKAGRQAIHQVAQSGQVKVVEFLVKTMGVSVNTKSSTSGETPLHVAAKERQTEMVNILLKLGCSIDTQDNRGCTALHMASGGQHRDTVTLLLRHRAKLLPDNAGQLPQQYAKNTDVLNAFAVIAEHDFYI